MTALSQGAASALWVMGHVGDRKEAEEWARTAVRRGASQELADATLAQWDRDNAPVVIGGEVA
jgi:hypothetical protein